MRLVDLRGTTAITPPTVEARASSAAELLRLLGVIASRTAVGDWDVGDERIARTAALLPDGLIERVQALGDEKAFLTLSIMAAHLDPPGDVDQLLTLLDDDPGLPWRTLLAMMTFDVEWPDAPPDSDAILAGDLVVLERLRTCCDEDLIDAPERLRRLVHVDPVEHGREVAEVVRLTRDAVWGQLEREAMGAIARDVAHREERIAAGDDVATIVIEAANGYEMAEDPSIRRVLLLPSFWLRPWLVVDQVGDTLVLSTPVADSFVALPAEAPPPALLKLSKALADEGRLKLLRRMATGPVSLGDAMQQLGVAKATAHHHLAILRQAGLVTMRGEGRTTRYALRHDPADAAREAIAAYVPTRSDASPVAELPGG